MPYLASNQDANQQEGFKTALMGAAVVLGGAALGAGMIGKMGDKLLKSNTDSVAKGLYGSMKNNLSESAIDSIKIRNASDIADSGMSRYSYGKNWRGKDRIYRKDGNFLENMRDSYFNGDVRAFNKTIGEYKNGKMGEGLYSGNSKLGIYNDLYERSQSAGLGVTSRDLTKVTNDIHNSSANATSRETRGWTAEKDIELTNSLWGNLGSSSKKELNGTYGRRGAVENARRSGAPEYTPMAQKVEAGKQAMAEREALQLERMENKRVTDPLADPNRKNRILRMQQEKRDPVAILNRETKGKVPERTSMKESIIQDEAGTIQDIVKATPYRKPEIKAPSVADQFERPQAKFKRGTGNGKGSYTQSESQLVKDLDNLAAYREQLDGQYASQIGPPVRKNGKGDRLSQYVKNGDREKVIDEFAQLAGFDGASRNGKRDLTDDELIRQMRKELAYGKDSARSLNGVVNMSSEEKNAPNIVNLRKRRAAIAKDTREDTPYSSAHPYLTNKSINEQSQPNWANKRFENGDENDYINIIHGGNAEFINRMLTHKKGYTTVNPMATPSGGSTKKGMMVHSENQSRVMGYANRSDNSAILTGRIQRKYAVANSVQDEFSIPEFNFDKIENTQIHRPGDKTYDNKKFF